jgi:hypothetical protein
LEVALERLRFQNVNHFPRTFGGIIQQCVSESNRRNENCYLSGLSYLNQTLSRQGASVDALCSGNTDVNWRAKTFFSSALRNLTELFGNSHFSCKLVISAFTVIGEFGLFMRTYVV